MNKPPGQGLLRVFVRLSMRLKERDKFRHTSRRLWRALREGLGKIAERAVSEYPSVAELIEALNDNVCGKGRQCKCLT